MARSHSFTPWVTGKQNPVLVSPAARQLTHDSTGYGQHGDYLFGWEDGALQKALDARCNLNNCAALKTQTAQQAMNCQKKQAVQEPFEGCKLASYGPSRSNLY